MTWLEIIAIVSTIVCVVLAGKENVLAWPVGIISALALIAAYIPNHLYANIGLQSISVIQCAFGWYYWGKKDEVLPHEISNSKQLRDLCCIFILGGAYGLVDVIINDRILLYPSYLDGISTFIALLGNWYLAKKRLQGWLLFMTYNIIVAVLLASQGVYALVLLNIVLFFISFNAYRTWKRNLAVV